MYWIFLIGIIVLFSILLGRGIWRHVSPETHILVRTNK